MQNDFFCKISKNSWSFLLSTVIAVWKQKVVNSLEARILLTSSVSAISKKKIDSYEWSVGKILATDVIGNVDDTIIDLIMDALSRSA